MTDILQFVGDLASFAGPIMIMVGVNAGPTIGALIGTLAGALSVVVGQGLQELARTEPPIISIPTEPPLVTTTTTIATPAVNQVSNEEKKSIKKYLL